MTPASRTVIRRIAADEWPALRAVRIAALTDTPEAFGSTLERELAFSDETWAQRATDSSSSAQRGLWLARQGADIVGVVGAFVDGDVVEVVSMWVAPTARRSSIGRQLVDAALDWARAVPVVRVDLWVVRGNERAMAFYESVGFVVTTDHQPLPSDPCKDELRMTRAV